MKRLIVLITFFAVLLTAKAYAVTVGSTMSNPIVVGTLSTCTGPPYMATANNNPANGYGNDYGQASDDIYYKFVLSASSKVRISLAGSDFDTYLSLLNSSGTLVAANDDNGPLVSGTRSSMEVSLAAGTYYAVVEGHGTSYGNISLNIDAFPPSGISAGQGSSMAIDWGTLSIGKSNSGNVNTSSCLKSHYNGQPSNDMWYKFTITETLSVEVNTCYSNFDTYLSILDANLSLVASNDDNNNVGSSCPGTTSFIEITLPPGTYYVIGEGYQNNTGSLTTNINIPWQLPDDGHAPLAPSPSQTQNYIATYTPYIEGVTDESLLKVGSIYQVSEEVDYFDGLGRPLQTVTVKGSPNEKDVVQPFVYDQFGRDVIKYLPYAQTSGTNDGSYKPDALTAGAGVFKFYNPTGSGVSGTQQSNGIVVIPSPFVQTILESSPLNRVAEQGASGADWQPVPNSTAGHTLKMVYTVNNTTDLADTANTMLVAQYTATINADQSRTLNRATGTAGNYDAKQLYVTVNKDENWISGRGGTTEEYKDKEGHIVLKRTFNYVPAGSAAPTILQFFSTYYVYDDLGNLAFVLPPGSNADNVKPDQAILDSLCYEYRYDERNRLIEKKIPGKGWEFIVYNSLDQVTFIQDANQRNKSNQEWTFTRYDAMGRVVITGVYLAGVGPDANIGSPGHSTEQFLTAFSKTHTPFWSNPDNTTETGYNTDNPPGQLLQVNYYDDYTFPGNPYPLTTAGILTNPTGLLTASKTTVLKPDGTYGPMLWTVHYYDDKGREVQTYQQHYLGGTASINNYDAIASKYNFSNQVTTTTRQHYTNTGTPGLKLTISNTYTYDHMGRKLDTKENINNTGEQLLVRLDYNETGQLYKKNLHGIGGAGSANLPVDDTLGSEDALISGQQKTVTATRSIVLAPGFSAPSGSTFKAQIAGYMQTVTYAYNERGWLSTSTAPLFAEQLYYNTLTSKLYNGNIANAYWGLPGNLNNHYNYGYDQLNRLISSSSVSGNDESGITYDLMGNITALNRTASNTQIDRLTYSYASNSNRLMSVNDKSGNTNGQKAGLTQYGYDGNGNLVSDDSKGITAISYNLLNLPQTIAGKNTTYTYDATGRKLRRVIGTTTTDYVSGIQYDGTTTTTSTISFIQTEEGRALWNGSTAYNYEYTLTDHLGNSRVNFDTATGTARLVQTDDYYPFGMDIIIGSRPSLINNYLYNKKELQDGLGQYDYGARFYDPVIARWTTVDPLAEKDRRWSPYSYGHNNPIRFIDVDGLFVKPGDLFASVDAAAKDFGKYYNGQSIREGREYASAIYKVDKDGKTYYTYTEANPGSKAGSTAPYVDNAVGDAHTHGAYTGNDPDPSERYDDDHFSPKDLQNRRDDKELGYVGTPDGSLQKFDPATNKTTVLSTDLPSDSRDPARKNDISVYTGNSEKKDRQDAMKIEPAKRDAIPNVKPPPPPPPIKKDPQQ
jgi:RHS repeat-associated protein